MARHSVRLGDYRRVLLSAFDLVSYRVALITVTGPGGQWSDEDVRRWNRSAARRWGKLDRRAKGRLRRVGLKVVPLARIAQRQRRGLDHLHLVVSAATASETAAIAAYVAHLKELAPQYGFGFVDDPFHLRRNPTTGKPQNMVYESAAIAGRYLTRYLTEKSGQLQALLDGGGYSFRPLWVSPALTQASGVNCRRLRRLRHAWYVFGAIKQGSSPSLPAWWWDIRERQALLSLFRGANAPPAGVALAAGAS
jgi:hypothetical protein